MPKKATLKTVKQEPRKLPVEISYPQNVPLETGAVFIVLPTLDELDAFWKANRQRLPYAAEDGGLVDGEIYLREYEWIFAPTITSLVKTVTRWDQLGIKPRYYDWEADEPGISLASQQDVARDREYEIQKGTWTELDEQKYQRNWLSYKGWWMLENLPDRFEGSPNAVFDDWIGQCSDSISDPTLAPEAIAEFMQNEFFKSWRHGNGDCGDVLLFDRAEMDKYVRYWKTERKKGQGYYGDEE